MRWACGLFGLICGAAVIAIVARYGYTSASSDVDGMITATLFGIIAAGALGGQAVAVRIWRHSVAWSLIIGLVSMLALVVNLTNSLGYIATFGEGKEAARVKVREELRRDKAALARLIKQRERMPAFTPASESSVAAARDAVAAAQAVREAECKRRGRNCRAREQDERVARDRLVKVENSLALAQQAVAIDQKIEGLRARVSKVAPVMQDNPQATALGLIFGLPVATVATYQKLALAAVVELLIVASLVAFELIGNETRLAAAQVRRKAAAQASPGRAPQASPAVVVGDVAAFVDECLHPAEDKQETFAALYQSYVAWCGQERQAVPRQKFDEWFCDGWSRCWAQCREARSAACLSGGRARVVIV